MTRKIDIFDTTLRDGEQSPGASMNTEEKLVIARQLLRMKVDVIEAGFPISSPGDFESVRRIASGWRRRDGRRPHARCREGHRPCSRSAQVRQASAHHTGLGVSPSHLHDKLRITEDQCLERAEHCVRYAKKYMNDVQFYAEDAGRSDYDFLVKVIQRVVDAGATAVNIPDTTGYSLPAEFGRHLNVPYRNVRVRTSNVGSLSQRPRHGNRPLALEGREGRREPRSVHVEAARRMMRSNTALEEVVMGIRMHGEELNAHTDINTREFAKASRLVSSITGMSVQANKAIVGANAFAHSSGIHQDGVLKKRDTYEIIDPADVGAGQSQIVLTARSGHAALKHRLEELGYEFEGDALDKIHEDFLNLADKKKEVHDEDLESHPRARPSGERYLPARGRADFLRHRHDSDSDRHAAQPG